MVTPPFLKKGDKIAIVAPSRKIKPVEISAAIRTLKTWGLEVVLGKNIFSQYHQFAGTDAERISDFQAMLDDSSVKAILCARGGYGCARIIDRLDFSHFFNAPKWIIGFSDITALLFHIHSNVGVETIHGAMAINFSEKNSGTAAAGLHNILFGEDIGYKTKPHRLNRKGHGEGELIGGNLSLFYSVRGTLSDIVTEGKILFLEDVDEYLYHIDRMMVNLKRSGMLINLKGLIVGGMTKMKDNRIPFGKTAEGIIAESVSEYDYPVCFGFPAGHIPNNHPLILGRRTILNVNKHVVLNFLQKHRENTVLRPSHGFREGLR